MSRRVVGKCDSRTFIKVSMISKNAIFEGFSGIFLRHRSNIKGISSVVRDIQYKEAVVQNLK